MPDPVEDEALLPRDAAGFRAKPKRSPLKGYTDGNLKMMKEYGMTEEEFAKEFGGRPHQQRQSPIAKSDLIRLNVHPRDRDYCSHRMVPYRLCRDAFGGWYSDFKGRCQHELHELEMCHAAENIRQNQVLQYKKRKHSMYTDAEKTWMYNDPNYGHMIWRSKYPVNSVRMLAMFGGGTRYLDPPRHEMDQSQAFWYNPDNIRSDPNPLNPFHKMIWGQGLGLKFFWNRHALSVPVIDRNCAPDLTVPFDPLTEKGPKPF